MATVGPDVMVRETARLIASDKVEGTPVRRSNGDKIGTIERVMIDKRSGRVAYAVMTFGGFLGIGEEYRALPWSLLRYNEDLDAYELNLTDEQLRGAPSYGTSAEFEHHRCETQLLDRATDGEAFGREFVER